MRRLFTLSLLVLLLLPSCRKQGVLPPGDVLTRAVAASGTLQSVRFDAEIDLSAGTHAATARAQGAMAGEGKQYSVALYLELTAGEGKNLRRVEMETDVFTELGETFLRLRQFASQPQTPSASALLDQWKKLPLPASAPAKPVTPDPEFLRAQAEVIRVDDDKGIESIRDRESYRYDISLDVEKAMPLLQRSAERDGRPFDAEKTRAELTRLQPRGAVWIDAQTFVIHRIQWTLNPSKEQPISLRFQLDLRDHNHVEALTAPSGATELPPGALAELLLPLLTIAPPSPF